LSQMHYNPITVNGSVTLQLLIDLLTN